MDTDELHVVFGASGGAGGAVVRALRAAERPVRAVTRSPGSVPDATGHAQADAMDGAAVRSACAGATVVYHCVNTPYETWPDTLPRILDNVIAGAAESGALLVYCDNLYMYGAPDGPIAEHTPLRPVGPKGALRARLAERLFEAHGRRDVRATSGRASDFYGPGAANTIAGQLVFPAVLEGRTARWLGSLDAPHTLHYIDDVGRGLVTLGTDERSVGEVWHLPGGPAVTGREFIGTAFESAGTEGRSAAIPSWQLRLAGLFSRRMREIAGIVYQFERPFVIDGSRFTATFGEPEMTSFPDGIGRSLAWHREAS